MSDKSHTDLGTKEIYKRHSVMIEGGKMPRAKVMDQIVVDRMLMNGLLTLQEHQAAEYILSQAASAGVYAKPLNYEPKSSGGMSKNGLESDQLMRYSRTIGLITKRFGDYAKYLVEEVVLHNWDVSDSPDKLKVLKKGLSWVADRRMAGGRNPVRHIRGK
tara:strand:- start:2738 stop:3217 length:480 start_codon:yes stop_codon:yes gene_type:complete